MSHGHSHTSIVACHNARATRRSQALGTVAENHTNVVATPFEGPGNHPILPDRTNVPVESTRSLPGQKIALGEDLLPAAATMPWSNTR